MDENSELEIDWEWDLENQRTILVAKKGSIGFATYITQEFANSPKLGYFLAKWAKRVSEFDKNNA